MFEEKRRYFLKEKKQKKDQSFCTYQSFCTLVDIPYIAELNH